MLPRSTFTVQKVADEGPLRGVTIGAENKTEEASIMPISVVDSTLAAAPLCSSYHLPLLLALPVTFLACVLERMVQHMFLRWR